MTVEFANPKVKWVCVSGISTTYNELGWKKIIACEQKGCYSSKVIHPNKYSADKKKEEVLKNNQLF